MLHGPIALMLFGGVWFACVYSVWSGQPSLRLIKHIMCKNFRPSITRTIYSQLHRHNQHIVIGVHCMHTSNAKQVEPNGSWCVHFVVVERMQVVISCIKRATFMVDERPHYMRRFLV